MLKKIRLMLNRILKTSIVLIILLFFAISAIRVQEYQKPILADQILNPNFDIIIVPGQGTQNSSADDVDTRLEHALKIFQKQQNKPRILVTGYGKSYLPRQETEAQAMYNQISENITKQGYNPKIFIIKENKSHQTIENAFYSRELISKNDKVLVLATAKAYTRTKMVFKELLPDYNIKVVSLQKPTKPSTLENIWIFGTSITIGLPTETLKLTIARTILFAYDITNNFSAYIESIF